MKWKLTRKFLSAIVVTVLSTLLCFAIAMALLFYHVAESPNEILEAKAPAITEALGNKIEFRDGSIHIEEKDLEELKKHDRWIQVLDENGTEIYSRFKPKDVPNHYTPGEIVSYHMYSGAIKGSTIFMGMLEKDGRNLTYVMGFPHRQIEKYSFNYNPETIIENIFKLLMITAGGFVAISIMIGYLLSIKLAQPIFDVMEGIKSLAKGEVYKKLLNKGIYKEVGVSLNNLSETLKTNELERKKTEKMREEWIANITHDIRTPLSSIKGYAELLSDRAYDVSDEEKLKYTKIILNKANYIETLMEDLKLTYQLNHVSMPLNKKEENVADLLRETIIDILNNPKYEKADICFETEKEEILLNCDGAALQRAFTNIIYNALVHNVEHTKVWVLLSDSNPIHVEIKDNGRGIAVDELEKLFERYYRGTNTGELYKGSGLGMAIAKQIIESHGGTIAAESELGTGTTIKIVLPETINLIK